MNDNGDLAFILNKSYDANTLNKYGLKVIATSDYKLCGKSLFSFIHTLNRKEASNHRLF